MKKSRFASIFLVILFAGLVLAACQGSAIPFTATRTPSMTATPSPTPTPMPSLSEVLAGVCQGDPVPGAGAYIPDHVPHPVVLTGSLPLSIPQEWLAGSLEQTELVICMEEREELIYNCKPSSGVTIDRYREYLSVRLVEARTGRQIKTMEFEGGWPAPCPIIIYSSSTENKKYIGSPPQPDDALPYLEPHILARQVFETDVHEFMFATSLAFSPDGSLLAGASEYNILLWDLSTGAILHRLPVNADYVDFLVFSHNSRILATGSPGGGAQDLWDVESGEKIRSLNSLEGVWKMIFSPDDSILASSDGERLVLVDWNNGSIIKRLDELYAQDLAFSPDGRFLVFIGFWELGFLDLSKPSSDPVMLDTERHDVVEPLFITFPKDGNTLITGLCLEYGEPGQCGSGEIDFWDIASRELIRTLPLPAVNVDQVIISSDGSRLASTKCIEEEGGCITNQIDIWDVESGEVLGSYHFHTELGEFDIIAFSPDSSLLASGGPVSQVILWDLSDLRAR